VRGEGDTMSDEMKPEDLHYGLCHEPQPVTDEPLSETSEQEHAHCCPVCVDSWQHASDECEESEMVPGYVARRTWATCPMCETQVS